MALPDDLMIVPVILPRETARQLAELAKTQPVGLRTRSAFSRMLIEQALAPFLAARSENETSRPKCDHAA